MILPRYVGGVTRSITLFVRHLFYNVYLYIVKRIRREKEASMFLDIVPFSLSSIVIHNCRPLLNGFAVSFSVASSFIQNVKSMSVIFDKIWRLQLYTYSDSYVKISRTQIPHDVSNMYRLYFKSNGSLTQCTSIIVNINNRCIIFFT